jgi:hypothetical protein
MRKIRLKEAMQPAEGHRSSKITQIQDCLTANSCSFYLDKMEV